MLRGFSNIFVQNEESQSILNVLGLKSIVAGDTRFDNVLRITKEGYTNEKIANWKGKDTLLVLGSSWHREEQLLIAYLSENASAKAIIAPHDISDGHLKEVVSLLEEQHISFAYWDDVITDSIQVVIINNIGILSKVYCYADIAVVGGGFKTKGLHNILEPLAWGVPVVTGPNITNNWEAVAAEKELLLMIVADSKEFEEALESLKKSENHATKARLFVSKYTNATELICQTV